MKGLNRRNNKKTHTHKTKEELQSKDRKKTHRNSLLINFFLIRTAQRMRFMEVTFKLVFF